jgi:hypothetical protein
MQSAPQGRSGLCGGERNPRAHRESNSEPTANITRLAALHRTMRWSCILEGSKNIVFLVVILSPSSGGTYSVEARASPYLRTPVPTPDRIYKPSTAQAICES